MKKTFTANINGKVFNIDEDAYNVLGTYLQQLRVTFGGNEGDEIASDIEERMSEHFNECITPNHSVITFADVNNVIKIMGAPGDIAGNDDNGDAALKAQAPVGKRLYRNMKNKVFGGVVGGLASYLGWNATIMRILLVVLALFTYLWPLVVIYLVVWMILPAVASPVDMLRMKGSSVTIDNIGRTVLESNTVEDRPNFIREFFSICGKVVMGIVGIIASIVCFSTICFFIAVLSGVIGDDCFDFPDILNGMNLDTSMPYVEPFMVMAWLFFTAIVSFALIWAAACVVFNAKGASRTTKIVGIVTAIIVFAVALTLSTLQV